MDIDKIPVIGKVNRTVNSIIFNFVLLGVVFLILGIAIIFFPKVLDLLVAALLIVGSAILFNIALQIHSTKKKYTKWIDG